MQLTGLREGASYRGVLRQQLRQRPDNPQKSFLWPNFRWPGPRLLLCSRAEGGYPQQRGGGVGGAHPDHLGEHPREEGLGVLGASAGGVGDEVRLFRGAGHRLETRRGPREASADVLFVGAAVGGTAPAEGTAGAHLGTKCFTAIRGCGSFATWWVSCGTTGTTSATTSSAKQLAAGLEVWTATRRWL